MAVTIHGAGCVLMDYLYRDVDFGDARVERLLRRTPGDGGLTIGGLVFADALERFAGQKIDALLDALAGGRGPDEQNVGGPAIVSLINTAQLCPQADVRFFGTVGDDASGEAIRTTVERTPVDGTRMLTRRGASAATYVLSDPDYDGGHGERMFINLLGVAATVAASDLGAEFPLADIVQLGGTALTPRLHDSMPELLATARSAGALTVVNTVYDFRAEFSAPDARWTLGSDDAYPLIDLLVTDAEEAARLSGRSDPESAVSWFLSRGADAAVVTNGPRPVCIGSSGGRFAATRPDRIPVFTEFAQSAAVREAEGDTTGCGDNFVGGVVAGIADQMEFGGGSGGRFDLRAAVRTGIVCGAFCMTHLGGTFLESGAGEKRAHIAPIRAAYDAAYGGRG